MIEQLKKARKSINQYATKFTRRNILILSAVCLLVLNAGFVIYALARINYLETRVGGNTASEKTVAGLNSTGQNIELNYFLNHPSVVEIGAKLKVEKNTVSTNNHPNCKTTVLPPIENGCQILISPAKLTLPGMRLTGIKLIGQIPETDEIHLEKLLFDKPDNPTVLGVATSSPETQLIPLRQSFAPQEILRLRFWNKSQSDIRLDKIIFSFVSFDSLRPVIVETSRPLEAAIFYLDLDKDKKYDPLRDIIWGCQPDFPGIRLEKSTNSTLVKRNDSCMNDSLKPESWREDQGQNALPMGSWLVNLNDGKPPVSFEVRDDRNVIQF